MQESASAEKIILEIPRRLVDGRFDVVALRLLREKFPTIAISRGTVSRLIRASRITLNRMPVAASHPTKLHDTIEAYASDYIIRSSDIQPKELRTEIPILCEDDKLIILDKPAGIQVHPVLGKDTGTIAHWLIARYPNIRSVGENALRPGIVHRLDKETSGVLVVAKIQAAFDALKKLFQKRQVTKKYIALVYGHMPDLAGTIDKPLMRRSGELKRFVVQTAAMPVSARDAVTEYRVLARYKEHDLLEVVPKTGRTHQIRVHLASLGHPIVGDKLYAFKSARRGEKLFTRRHMLHAHRLKFELFSKSYDCFAPLSTDFREVLCGVDETRETSYDNEALKSLVAE